MHGQSRIQVNMKQRSQMLGMDVWNEGSCPVQVIDHHRWERRFASSRPVPAFESYVQSTDDMYD